MKSNVEKFIEIPLMLKEEKKTAKKVVLVLGIIFLIFAVVAAVGVGLILGLVVLGCTVPFLLLYYISVCLKISKYNSFVKSLYSLGLDKEIEKGILIDDLKKICITDNYLLYNDYNNIIGTNKTMKFRWFYEKLSDVVSITQYEKGNTIYTVNAKNKKHLIKTQYGIILFDALKDKAPNINIELMEDDETKTNTKPEKHERAFKHEIYGDLIARPYEKDSEKESIFIESPDKSLALEVKFKDFEQDQVIYNDDMKKQILDNYHDFIIKNLDVCRDYFIDKEVDTIYHWLSNDTPDIETNEFYTKNKTVEEFKKVLYEKLTLETLNISIDANCQITQIEFSPSFNNYNYTATVFLFYSADDGEVDLDSMDVDFVS